MGKDLGNVRPVFGWDLVLYEPNMDELGPKGGCIVVLNDVLDEPFFNFNLAKQIVGSNNDESDSAVEAQQTQTIPQTNSKPAEWGSKRRFKTTIFGHVSSPVGQPRAHSLGSSATLPLPKDVVKPFAKKSTSKSAKESTPSPP